MNPLSVTGAIIVTLALVSYGIGIISEQVRRQIIHRVIIFITLGVALDVTATVCMILGSQNDPFTLHGSIGYSALFIMLIELVWIWRVYRRNGIKADVPRGLHIFSRVAYIWWVVAYITGSLIAMT